MATENMSIMSFIPKLNLGGREGECANVLMC